MKVAYLSEIMIPASKGVSARQWSPAAIRTGVSDIPNYYFEKCVANELSTYPNYM